MKKNIVVSAFSAMAVSAAVVSLAACGDDVTRVTENYEMNAQTVKSKSALPHCNSTKTGALVFVSDSAQVFVCDGTNWASLQGADGKDGVEGKQGAIGKQGETGAAGEGCTAKSVTKEGTKGFEITCGDVVDTLWNGLDGKKGEPGAPGSSGSKGEKGDPGSSGAKGEPGAPGSSGAQGLPGSSGAQGIPGSSGAGCVATNASDGARSGLSIVCGDESESITLWDGAPGSSGSQGLPGSSGAQGLPGSSGAQGLPGSSGADGVGCSIESDVGGVITIVCGEGDDATRTTIYKAMCGSNPYDPDDGLCVNGNLVVKGTYTDTYGTYETGVSNVYNTVQIGDLVWMDNMRATASNAASDDNICAGNDCGKNGRFYTLERASSICPSAGGWRRATVADWQNLFCTVDENSCSKKLNGNLGDNITYDSQLANKLKTYGFEIVYAGHLYLGGVQEPNTGFYWAAQGNDAVVIKVESSQLFIAYFENQRASLVRCVKDAE